MDHGVHQGLQNGRGGEAAVESGAGDPVKVRAQVPDEGIAAFELHRERTYEGHLALISLEDYVPGALIRHEAGIVIVNAPVRDEPGDVGPYPEFLADEPVDRFECQLLYRGGFVLEGFIHRMVYPQPDLSKFIGGEELR